VVDYVVLGAAGMLGRAFVQNLSARGSSFLALGRKELDLRDADATVRAVEGARVVINCAAYTNVDGAESDEGAATETNGLAVGRLAAACSDAGATLVHFSTDYVFDGQAREPYPTDGVRRPINAYGRSKAVGEELLEASSCRYLLIRTSWVYAPWGKNFVLTMAKLLREKPRVQVVDDQRGRPTSSLWLAEASLRLVEAKASGTFHLTDGGECSWYELARTIGDVLGTTATVDPCSSDEFPRPAPRPAFSTLDLTKSEAILGAFPHFSLAVRETLALSTG